MKNIIVVDDSPAILDSVELMLNFEGFKVQKFAKGSEMLEKIKHQQKPDAILMDMWLSGEDGRDICHLVRKDENLKDVPVVIMSASTALAQSAVDAGADSFIAKPFDLGEMLDVIVSYTEHQN